MKRSFAGFCVLVCLAAMATGCCCLQKGSKSSAPAFALRVIAGTPEAYTDKAGNVWQGEKTYEAGAGFGFVDGETVDRGAELVIEGTNDPRIYQTERYMTTQFVAEVPNGTYRVVLHFAETYDNIDTDGPRVFDVTVQGQTKLDDFDVQKTAGKSNKAVVETISGVQVTDGLLKIGFVAGQQNTEINGIEILSE